MHLFFILFTIVIFIYKDVMAYPPSIDCQQIFTTSPFNASSRDWPTRADYSIYKRRQLNAAFLLKKHIFCIAKLKTRWLPEFQ